MGMEPPHNTYVDDMAAELEAAGRTWTFASCLQCRQMAAVAPSGEVFCQTCISRAERLQELLASVARPVVYQSLKSFGRGTTHLATPRVAAW